MSTRGRRARGRPPKTPVSTNRTNFLRKPKAYQNLELNSNVNNVGSASPVSHYKPSRGGRGRAAAHKSRQFLSQITAEDDELSSLPEFENDRTSDFTDDIDSHNADGNGSDVSFATDEDEDLSENESLSTVSSSISKKRLLLKRPKTPEIQDDKDIPLLNLPASATDLLLPTEHILQAVGIYEVLRHFRITLRLSPFTFEDFCAALLSDEQSSLLAELHITLLKALFREDEGNSTTFGPQDTKDSVNVSLFFLDSMTWPEILRAFLDSEKHPEYRRHLSVVETSNYPFVPYADKMKVLQTLTDLVLATTKVREEIINEGNIHYDDHCRACHKLGDLLCCETCSAVYHLACVEPPMQEVPEDDWLCSVCRAHQVKGVTDCVSEAEKSGLLSRQEPIGYDRHARKYWFLCRRIIVEGEKETWYYSTKYQLDELLECLESAWESDLISFLSELKDDILKQITLTEELTNSVKGSKKSVLDVENAQLVKVQAERAQKKVKEEEERKTKEEEEKQRKEKEEEERKLELEKQKEKEAQAESEKADEIQPMNTDGDISEEITETDSEAVVTTKTHEISSSVKENAIGEVSTEVVETVTTTTTITTVTSTSVKTVATAEESSNKADEEEPVVKKAKLDDSKVDGAEEKQNESSANDSKDSDSKSDDNSVVVNTSSALAEAIKSTSDGKPKVISLQSLLPAARQGLLKAVDKNGDDGKSDGQTKTVLLVNREGDKVTLQVQRQPINKDDDKGNKTTTSSSTSVSASAIESRKMLTRSKTGSLTPKLFTDSITMTTTSTKVAGKSTEETVATETSKSTRSKVALATSISQQSQYFKLGSDNSYKQYQNQYTTNTLALNKHQHNEERDKKRHLSHKFSLTQTFEFKWSGNVLGNRASVLATLRATITALEGNVQAPFMHSNWPAHKQQWQKAVQMSQTPRDFALALSVLEACIKPCVFNPIWHEAIGHVRLSRITVSDREEWKKKEKEQRRRREDEDDVRPLVWIKYTLGLKHQVWKLKGEEYRVTGGNGWQWLSSTWRFKEVPQGSVGLRGVAQKAKERRVKAAKTAEEENKGKTDEAKPVASNDSANVKPVASNDSASIKPVASNDSASVTKEASPVETNDVEMADASPSGECASGSEPQMETEEQASNESDHSKDVDSTESSSLKTEKMDTSEENPDIKTEPVPVQDNEIVSKEKAKEPNNTTVDIKEENVAPVEVKENKQVPKKKSAKQTRLDGIYQDFITFMKNKYKEDKEEVFALDLLKKHPEKTNEDVINVSEALQKRTHFPKITKPYSKLDNLLERRLRQDEFERKQRLTIETQIALKLKLNQAIADAKKKKEEKEKKKEAEQAKLMNGDINAEKDSTSASSGAQKDSPSSSALPYSCYSACHKKEPDLNMVCYSPACRKYHSSKLKKSDESKNNSVVSKDSNDHKSVTGSVDKNLNDKVLSKSAQVSSDASDHKSTSSNEKSEETAADGEKKQSDGVGNQTSNQNQQGSKVETPKKSDQDGGEKVEESEKKNPQSTGKLDISTEDEDVDIEGIKEGQSTGLSQLNSSGDKKPNSTATNTSANEKKPEPTVTNSGDRAVESETSKSSSVSEIVKNLVIKTMAEKAVETSSRTGISITSSQVLSSAVVNTSLEDLKAKLPPKHHTSDSFKLGKFTRITSKKISRVSKNGRLPMCHRFETASNLKSILVLDKNELKRLARLGSKRESLSFNYNCKINNVCWPYPCPRPFFKTGWRYRTMTLSSLSAAALQLRILWACMRWDDMAAKPPAGGTNTVSTETEITTTELLKRREVGTDGLRSEFQVRKIVVPLGVPDKPKEKYTPQRSGLRERKRQEAARQTEPSVTEVWVPEEVLELWEIKQFGEKLEKQRQALQEKAKESGANQQSTVTSQQTAAQIKAQMEQQLKQQRLALAQKRIQESQGIKITTTASAISSLSTSSSATTIIINNASSLGKPGATFKTLTVSSPSSLLSPGIIKTMQPKTVITNAGSLLGTQQLRPGIRVQLQGSSLQLRPQTVTLAPKPGTTVVTTSGVSTITRLISPSPTTRVVSPAAAQTKTQTIQIKPQTAGQPVQNLQLIQQPGGQLQVKGFLPGQIIQRMPDGKLQIISLNTSSTPTNSTSSISSSVSSSSLQSQTRPAISIQPQTIMVSIPGPTSSSPTVTQNRLVIPAQLASSVGLALSQGASPSTITIPSSRSVLGGTVVTTTPQKHMIITRPGGQVISAQNIAAPTITSLSSVSGALNSAVIISAPSAVNTSISSNVLVNNSQAQTQLSSLSSPVVCVSGNQTLISTLRPVVASQSLSTTTTSVTTSLPVSSLLTGQVISGTSLLPRPGNSTSLLNISGSSGGSITLPAPAASTGQIPKLLASPPVGAQIIRPLGSSQAQLVIRPGSTLLTGAGQAKVITAQQLKGLTSTPIQLKPATSSASPIKTILSPQSSALILPSTTKTSSAMRSLTTQLTSQTSSPQQATLLAAPKQSTPAPSVSLLQQGLTVTAASETPPANTITSPTSVTSPSAGASVPKYAITPQVVEQVVRQALLQNQTPEIQQKLLAMQRQIQQQRGPTSTAGVGSVSSSTPSIQRIAQSTTASASRTPSSSSSASELRISKHKGLSQEQKEEQSRNSVCGQVMKNILDRIEREEKQEQRNKKKLESAEEKQKRVTAINQQKALFKHKEALKKEILRKRSLMEKNLQQEIYNEMAEKVKKAKMSTSPSKSPHAGATVSPNTSATATSKKAVKQVETPKAVQANAESKSASRKRKQKIISTGIKSLNPREKLYCVCKTPYDDSKFYIGCDLCSNWFHGACVNISEDQAKFIDSYICEDCRKQQENTSEELYCLCRTPYDENQFYIGCDRCQDWFHGFCVGISKNEADGIDVYLCPNCQKQETADPIAQRPLTQSEFQQLIKLLKDLKVHKMAWPFLQPVDPREVPDYYNVIMEPMDLTIIEERLNTKSYEKLNDFVKDVTKIFDNCRFYNPVGTPYYQCAEVVETYFAQRIKALRSTHKL